MRVAFMSDLHRGFWPEHSTRLLSQKDADAIEAGTYVRVPFTPFGPDLSKIRGRCDLLVVAGDFDVGDSPRILHDAAEFLGVPVVYVPGNHEFYGGNFERVMTKLHLGLPAGGAHLLDRTELMFRRGEDSAWDVVNTEATSELSSGSQHSAFVETLAATSETDKVRLLGCILWTDFGLYGDDYRTRCKQLAGSLISDYSRIFAGPPVDADRRLYRRLTPSDTHGFHIQDRHWLEGKLDEPFDGETVVVTHMAPSIGSVPERYKEDPLSAAFASNLDGLIERTKPALWIHGHTHDSFDYRIGRTRVVCNPYGYYGQELNPDFREDMVVDLFGEPSAEAEAGQGTEREKAGERSTKAVKRDWTLE